MTTIVQAGLAPARVRLDNGAVVLAKESRAIPAVTIHAAFRAGSVYDTDFHLGLAHFVSRTIDRGTAHRDAGVIAETLDSRGVALNVAATRHTLALICTCLAEDFGSMLELVGDIAMHPTFPDEEIATRRAEIVTLIRQDQDSPAVMAVEGLLALLYPDGHAYGRRSKGTIETVERIDREALCAFHRTRFAPSSLSLAIVGDIESAKAIEAAALVFEDWRVAAPAATDSTHAPEPRPQGAPAARRQLVIPMMNKAQADIAYGFTSVRRSDPAYYALWLMNTTLGQYAMGGRLGDSIRERQGMAYYVFSSFDANILKGPLMIRAGVNPANVERAIATMDEEVARMAAEGVTDRELADSKRYLIGSMPRTLETNAAIAAFLQSAAMFELGVDHDLRLPALIEGVTREMVHEAARRVLAPERAAVVVAGPYTGG